MKRLYLISCFAQSSEAISHRAILRFATSEEEAVGKGDTFIREHKPTCFGWGNYSVGVALVAHSDIIEAYEAIQNGN